MEASVQLAQSFSLVANKETKALILGSMPGKASLIEQQYYAHPRNCFWRLMEDLLSVDHSLPYHLRLKRLLDSGFGLWDVIQHCQRATSLDADIVGSSVEVNDFIQFFRVHRKIRSLYFNGAKAEAVFKQQVLPQLKSEDNLPIFTMKRLPSTSPAHASLDYHAKLELWSEIISDL